MNDHAHPIFRGILNGFFGVMQGQPAKAEAATVCPHCGSDFEHRIERAEGSRDLWWCGEVCTRADCGATGKGYHTSAAEAKRMREDSNESWKD